HLPAAPPFLAWSPAPPCLEPRPTLPAAPPCLAPCSAWSPAHLPAAPPQLAWSPAPSQGPPCTAFQPPSSWGAPAPCYYKASESCAQHTATFPPGTALATMGEIPYLVHSSLDPDHLWIWSTALYVDEHQRTWLPITIETETGLQVLIRQLDVQRGEAMCPSQLPPSRLPLMWQLYPGRRYRASDSSFWRIVYHIEASVRRAREPFSGTEDLLLEQLPDPDE
ncbi:T-cell leukemia/lymphoma protein 1A, partial [Galemys pyrenaicus]